MKFISKKIGLDFDGTCVRHGYPDIGEDIGAQHVLRELVTLGHRLILDTMRSNGLAKQRDGKHRNTRNDARNWFNVNNIKLYADGKDKGQERWTMSNKCHCDIHIDDRNLGVPLLEPKCVDWYAIRHMLMVQGVIPEYEFEIDDIVIIMTQDTPQSEPSYEYGVVTRLGKGIHDVLVDGENRRFLRSRNMIPSSQEYINKYF